jgi:CHAD domain-containing protein
LLEYFEEMLGEEPRAWEGLDPEGVHKMRVAIRRIRAVFRAFKRVLPGAAQPLNRELKWVAGVLGKVRDLDVQQGNFHHYAAEIPDEFGAGKIAYQKHLAESWDEARKGLLACLSSPRYQRLKDDFVEFLRRGASEAETNAAGAPSIGDAAVRTIGRQYKRVLRRGRAIKSDSPDDALHALRIDCKRLRYLIEFFRPVYGKPLRRFVKWSRNLQDVLGEFNDACVAAQHLRQYAESVAMEEGNRDQLIVLGQLLGVHGQQAAVKRACFHKIWKQFDRKGRRKRLVDSLN